MVYSAFGPFHLSTAHNNAHRHTRCPYKLQAMPTKTLFHFAPQPNCRFNADANIGHAFGIFMAYVGALQPSASGAG
jgi:hypothetical protein